MFSSTIELLYKELQLLRKFRRPTTQKLPQDERIRLFMKTRDFTLVELLEERWSYGCDLEVDLCRILQVPIEWSLDLWSDHKVETSSKESQTYKHSYPEFVATSVVSPQMATAFALSENKTNVTFEDEIKYLSKL